MVRARRITFAARVSDPIFYENFYGKLIDKAEVRKTINASLPTGVTAQIRSDGQLDYVCIMNFSGKEADLLLDAGIYEQAETGEVVDQQVRLQLTAY